MSRRPCASGSVYPTRSARCLGSKLRSPLRSEPTRVAGSRTAGARRARCSDRLRRGPLGARRAVPVTRLPRLQNCARTLPPPTARRQRLSNPRARPLPTRRHWLRSGVRVRCLSTSARTPTRSHVPAVCTPILPGSLTGPDCAGQGGSVAAAPAANRAEEITGPVGVANPEAGPERRPSGRGYTHATNVFGMSCERAQRDQCTEREPARCHCWTAATGTR
jgi:hypothetical protein